MAKGVSMVGTKSVGINATVPATVLAGNASSTLANSCANASGLPVVSATQSAVDVTQWIDAFSQELTNVTALANTDSSMLTFLAEELLTSIFSSLATSFTPLFNSKNKSFSLVVSSSNSSSSSSSSSSFGSFLSGLLLEYSLVSSDSSVDCACADIVCVLEKLEFKVSEVPEDVVFMWKKLANEKAEEEKVKSKIAKATKVVKTISKGRKSKGDVRGNNSNTNGKEEDEEENSNEDEKFSELSVVEDDDEDGGDVEDPDGCRICERDIALTRHHLIPKQTHSRYMKRGFTAIQLNTGENILLVCRQCHSAIHGFWDNATLAEKYNTLEKLMAEECVQKWAKYASKQRVKGGMKLHSRK